MCYNVVRCCKLYVFYVCSYNDDDLKWNESSNVGCEENLIMFCFRNLVNLDNLYERIVLMICSLSVI
jgi:hypothetical protein